MKDTYSSKWAAQFLAAGELSRQGYKVAILLGNAPGTDLLVESPKGIRFGVQCKGLKSSNFWPINENEVQELLYYILVLAPREAKKKPRYFVMTGKEVIDKIRAYRVRSGVPEPSEGKPKFSKEGFNFKTAFDCEDKWEKMPR